MDRTGCPRPAGLCPVRGGAPRAGGGREEPRHGSRERCTAGVPSALAQLSALVQQPPTSNPANISRSPFASHPWSYNSLSFVDTLTS